MKIFGIGDEEVALKEIAILMCLSAKTAPKGKGEDSVETLILTGEDKDKIADEMMLLADKFGKNWIRDAKNVKESPVLILLGLKSGTTPGVNCGACGFENCNLMLESERKEWDMFQGPNCIIRAIDLGIALGSAVKTAQIHNVDNRVFFRAGVVAHKLKYLPNCSVVLAIPLSAKSKNIFFDR
ncbi:MAG: ferredoxin domain-containing protein [Candidatus Odinarchaeia archaeon]